MIKKCEICGTVFTSASRQKYCSDSCRKVASKLAMIRYNAKQRVKTVASTPVVAPVVTPVVAPKVATKRIISVKELDKTQVQLDYVTRSINALKNLDDARKQVQDIIDVLKIEQSKYNKEDFEFAHSVEGSGSLSDSQKLKIFNEYKDMRSKRRNVKDIIKVLICCIRYTPYNSEKIIKDALQSKIKVDEFFKDFYKQKFQ